MTQKDVLSIDRSTLEDAMQKAKKHVGLSLLSSNRTRLDDREKIIPLYETFIGTYLAVRDTLDGSEIFNTTSSQLHHNAHVDCYAAHVASLETIFSLEDEPGAWTGSFAEVYFKKSDMDKESRKKIFIHEFITNYLDKTSKVKSHLDLFISYMYNLADQSKRSFAGIEGSSLFEEKIDSVALKVNGNVFSGFGHQLQRPWPPSGQAGKSDSVSRAPSQASRPLQGNIQAAGTYKPVHDTSFDDIVGHEDIKGLLKPLIENVFEYDTVSGTNYLRQLRRFPSTVCIEGDPGTGKTTLLKASISYAADISDRHDMPFEAVFLDNNSFKDEYFSRSSQNLDRILTQVQSGDKIYIVAIEDFDTIFFGRDQKESGSENKAILGTLLNILEGLKTSNKGNYLIISTSNKPMAAGSAVLRRLTEASAVALGPQTADEQYRIFQVFLPYARDDLSLEQWNNIGHRSLEYELVGGDIKNICTKINHQETLIKRDGDWFGLPVEERRRRFSEYLDAQRIDRYSLILGEIEQYQQIRIQRRQKEDLARIESQAREMLYKKKVLDMCSLLEK